MSHVIPIHEMPSRLVNDRYEYKTSKRATPEQRVKGLLGFPFSDLIRRHTISQLLDDPETAELAREFLNK